MAKRALQIGIDNECYYTLADGCKMIGKARSTIMRLLPSWETTTGKKPRKDHSGRWLLPTESVHALRDDPALYLRLAGRATKWEDAQKKLESDNKQLKAIIRGLGKPTFDLLRTAHPDLLGDL